MCSTCEEFCRECGTELVWFTECAATDDVCGECCSCTRWCQLPIPEENE